jgi:lysophospholipase L1-like esterase
LQAELATRYTLQSPSVDNQGRSGEAATGPSTFARFVARTSTVTYDAVLLMEGANDLGYQSYPAITAALGQMVDFAKSRGLRVLLATIPPENAAGCCPYDRGVQAGLVAGLDAQIRLLSASKQVPLVDVYQAFGGDAPDLSLIGPDGLHPTAMGYHRIADTFFLVIKTTLESAAATTARPTPAGPTSLRPPVLPLPRRPPGR